MLVVEFFVFSPLLSVFLFHVSSVLPSWALIKQVLIRTSL